jgi:hypothetical protein
MSLKRGGAMKTEEMKTVTEEVVAEAMRSLCPSGDPLMKKGDLEVVREARLYVTTACEGFGKRFISDLLYQLDGQS